MNLIGITGKLESGKSTLASMIVKKATIECKRYAFASALKNMCTDYFGFKWVDLYTVEGKKTIHPLWGITTREFMQRLGQGLRDGIAPDVWVKVLETQLLREQETFGLAIIDDVRMPNEVEMVHRLGGIMIRVTRPNHISESTGIQNHPSEQDLSDDIIDFDIVNNSTKEDLFDAARKMIPMLKKITVDSHYITIPI